MEKDEKAILLVDDSPLVTERLIDLLRNAPVGKNILTAANYNEALAVMENISISVVLLDIKLPEKSGLDILKFIVKHYPGVHVVMLTNLVSDYYKRLCKKAGATYFIDKSKDFELIPGILQELTGKQQ